MIFLQYGITKISVYSKFVRKIIKGEPRLLFSNGEFIEKALRKNRVTESEVLATIRANGIGSVEEFGAVVLETDGSFGVIKKNGDENRNGLARCCGENLTCQGLSTMLFKASKK